MTFQNPPPICRAYSSCPDSDFAPWLYGISDPLSNLPYHFLSRPRQICSPGCMAFQTPSPICHTLFCPDQDLIPCPRLDFLLRHFRPPSELPYSGSRLLLAPLLWHCSSLRHFLFLCKKQFYGLSKLQWYKPRAFFWKTGGPPPTIALVRACSLMGERSNS